MYGYIYKTTDLTNNKIYIGQHKSTIFNNKYLGSGVIIKRAIKEHGKNNFKVELIESCDTQEDLNIKEVYYIDLYNSRDSSIGYNIVQGGQERFFTGQKHTEMTKEKMSKKAKNRPHPPTTKGRISITNGKENHMVDVSELSLWEQKGFYKGKTMSGKPAWNKGLTKDTDDRVKKYTTSRNKHFENGESIGCYGVKGNTYGFKNGNEPWNKGSHLSTHILSQLNKEQNK